VLAAIGDAEAIVIGPSNPVISIGPIVSMPAVREAISASAAPVVAVSPYVAGQVVKGPTDLFMRAIGRPSSAAGAASLYQGLLDGMICDPEDPDPPPEGIRIMSSPTLMLGRAGRRELAERTLEFASMLAGQP
jgi:LPPG:FO 2-phospho-L-lactate transferase